MYPLSTTICNTLLLSVTTTAANATQAAVSYIFIYLCAHEIVQ
jgi:hypothetical protein